MSRDEPPLPEFLRCKPAGGGLITGGLITCVVAVMVAFFLGGPCSAIGQFVVPMLALLGGVVAIVVGLGQRLFGSDKARW